MAVIEGGLAGERVATPFERDRSSGRTLAGDRAAEERIERDLRAIASAVRERVGGSFRALLLVGGYARREGSLVADRAGALGPYNDYDFVTVVEGDPGRWRAPLAELGHELHARVGVDVDLWPFAEHALGAVPPTLFWLDVGLGAVEVIEGDRAVLARLRVRGPREIPLDECGRLLANRATGIALSNLERDPDRDLRRARHGHKAVLAVGDSLLLAIDRYRGTVDERLRELEQLERAPSVGPELVRAYRDAARFRARPDAWRPSEGDLTAWFARTREAVGRWHLAFEAWRAGAPSDPLAYARHRGRLFPDLPDVRAGGGAVASLRAAVKRELPLFPWLGHPRERLARVAVAVAYGVGDPAARAEAARLLGLDADADAEALHAGLARLTARGG